MTRPVAFLVIVLLAIPARPAAAQFRFAGGANLSDFFGADAGATERRSGLDLGMTIPLFRVGPAQLLAEGYYRQKGARSVEEFQQAALEGRSIDVGIDYVEVPVLLRVSLPGLGRRVFPWLQGGAERGGAEVPLDLGAGFNALFGKPVGGHAIGHVSLLFERHWRPGSAANLLGPRIYKSRGRVKNNARAPVAGSRRFG